jgi:hypothetical protein
MEKVSGFMTRNITDTRATDVENAQYPMRWVGAKLYRWVKNSTGGALTAGGAYTFGTAGSPGFWAELFTFGQSSKGTSVNGPIAVAVSAIPADHYGWVQVGGEASAQIGGAAGSNVAALGNLKGVSGQIYLTLDTAVGTAATGPFSGVALAAGNSNAANTNILLKLPNC